MRLLLSLLCLLWSAPAWALAGWSFQRTIDLPNVANPNVLVDYTHEVNLTPANFTFASAAADGRDVRYTLMDGVTTLYHCERAWNSTSVMSWINVPLVAASGTGQIKIWYGNPAATSDSDCTSTFSPPAAAPTLVTGTNGILPFPMSSKIVECSPNNLLMLYVDGSTNDNNDAGTYSLSSSDNGATWGAPVLVYKVAGKLSYVGAMDKLASGVIMATLGKQTIPSTDGDVYITTTADCGATWSAPVGPIFNPYTTGQYTYGNIRELTPGGTLITPVFGRDATLTYFFVMLLQSVDSGATWSTRGTIANVAGRILDETSIVCTTATHCLAVIRDDTAAWHSAFSTTSDDGGSTWAALRWISPSYSKIWVSPDLIQLADTQVMLCVGERPLNNGKGIRCLISRDGGATWPEGNQIFAAEAGTLSMNIGYPSTVQLTNGSLATTYYAHQPSSTGTVSVLVSLYTEKFAQATHGKYDGGEGGNLAPWATISAPWVGNYVTVPTTQPHSGSYSLYFNDQSTTAFLNKYLSYSTTAALTSSYPESGAHIMWVYVPAVPQAVPLVVMDPDLGSRYMLRVLPGGTVVYVNSAGVEVALPTPTVITLNAWHEFVFSFSMLMTPVQGTSQVRIDNNDKGSITYNTAVDGYLGSVGVRTGKVVADTGDQAYIDDVQFMPYTPIMPGPSTVGAESGTAFVPCP